MKPAILIVDDEKNIRNGLARALSENYIIYQAGCGKDAIRKLQKNSKIELILSDIKMPEMEGLELIERIAAEKISIPVIFISACCSLNHISRAMQNGAYNCLSKPIDLNKLEVIIKNALADKKLKAVAAPTHP